MFDQTQSQILDGLLLGDGCLPVNQNLFYFGQSRANREYVEYVARQLGLSADRIHDRTRKPDPRTGRIYECSELRTLSHSYFASLRERWYRGGVKVVPGDLQVSPAAVLHWFLCDGSCSVNHHSAQMVLCTDGFTRPEVAFLKDQLESVGIEARVVGRRLRVRQKSVGRFYEYIGESPVRCLAHKWVPEEYRERKLQDLQPHYRTIFRLYSINGWSCDRIGKKFNSNYFSVRYILKNHFGIRFGKNPASETTCREGVVAPSETARRALAQRE